MSSQSSLNKLVLATFCLLPCFAGAASLFESDAPLEMRIEAPFGKIAEVRDKSIRYPATVSIEGATYDAAISARGNSRLQSDRCDNPLLWLWIMPPAPGTPNIFGDQLMSPVVVMCRDDPEYLDRLRGEYLVYRMYEHVQPVSFRTRWLDVHYVDTNGEQHRQPAFIVEHRDRMAERLGLKFVDVDRVPPAEIEPVNGAMNGLFNFVMSNQDYRLNRSAKRSDTCCHNGMLFSGAAGGLRTVVYDFDLSRMVRWSNRDFDPADFKVMEYRGLCDHNEELDDVRQQILDEEPYFRQVISDDPVLSEQARKTMLAVLAKSYSYVKGGWSFRHKVKWRCSRGE